MIWFYEKTFFNTVVVFWDNMSEKYHFLRFFLRSDLLVVVCCVSFFHSFFILRMSWFWHFVFLCHFLSFFLMRFQFLDFNSIFYGKKVQKREWRTSRTNKSWRSSRTTRSTQTLCSTCTSVSVRTDLWADRSSCWRVPSSSSLSTANWVDKSSPDEPWWKRPCRCPLPRCKHLMTIHVLLMIVMYCRLQRELLQSECDDFIKSAHDVTSDLGPPLPLRVLERSK